MFRILDETHTSPKANHKYGVRPNGHWDTKVGGSFEISKLYYYPPL